MKIFKEKDIKKELLKDWDISYHYEELNDYLKKKGYRLKALCLTKTEPDDVLFIETER